MLLIASAISIDSIHATGHGVDRIDPDVETYNFYARRLDNVGTWSISFGVHSVNDTSHSFFHSQAGRDDQVRRDYPIRGGAFGGVNARTITNDIRMAITETRDDLQSQISYLVSGETDKVRKTIASAQDEFADATIDKLNPLVLAGDRVAQYKLGRIYLESRGPLDPDPLSLLELSAEQNYLPAQNHLSEIYFGRWYHNGRVQQDADKMLRWTRKACRQNSLEAQQRLGMMYKYGHGVPQDYTQMAYWWRLAADQGYPVSQCDLGWAYDHGNGVPQNPQEALSWYGKAARQGYQEAITRLDELLPLHREF